MGRCFKSRVIKSLEEHSVNVLVAAAWKSDKGVQSGSILECCGFQRLNELPKYWAQDSVQHGYSCPVCGPPPCQCSAVLYVRSRHASPTTP